MQCVEVFVFDMNSSKEAMDSTIAGWMASNCTKPSGITFTGEFFLTLEDAMKWLSNHAGSHRNNAVTFMTSSFQLKWAVLAEAS